MKNKIFSFLLINLLLCSCSLNIVDKNFNSSSLESNSASSFVEKNSTSNSTTNSSSSTISVNNSFSSTFLEDPYMNVSFNQFYSNYQETTSYEDAMYRTKHGFISGSINYGSYLPQKNTIYSGNKFVKFSNYTYGYDSNYNIISYNINTKDGTYKTIYYNAGYVVLEEVAAYILAFGEVPPNNNYDKGSTGKKQSIAKWGKYGRVNIGKYSNDTDKYPNEPELPLKDSRGKAYQYIETDIGLENYNNGSKIDRGSYRIVFTGSYKDGSKITDINERYVFYTYNHYEDFEEYLNYYGGWGNRFGYETSNYSTPTSYIEAVIVDKNDLE